VNIDTATSTGATCAIAMPPFGQRVDQHGEAAPHTVARELGEQMERHRRDAGPEPRLGQARTREQQEQQQPDRHD
jgi:hypothetical protein